MTSVPRVRLSERTTIRMSLGHAALCVGSAALGLVDAARPLVEYLFYVAFGLLFVVAFSMANATPRRVSLTEIWENAPSWSRDFLFLALAWLAGAVFGDAQLFEHPFERRGTPIGDATPAQLMLPFAVFTCLNALTLTSYLAARALGLEDEAPPETPAEEAGETVLGVPKAVRVTLALAVGFLFASEIADVCLRAYGNALLPQPPPGYALSCANPKCGEADWACHPKSYTLCETLAGPTGEARYYRGFTITTYRFEAGRAGPYSELNVLGILVMAVLVTGIALISLADRRGVKLGVARLRLSNMPRSHIPAVCGLILVLAGAATFAKQFLQDALPHLLAAARGAS